LEVEVEKKEEVVVVVVVYAGSTARNL